MPRIINKKVLAVLADKYFDHHAAMHLAREHADVSGGRSKPLILPPAACTNCSRMIPAGEARSGTQFLDMHHEMIQVFRYFLKDKLGAQWKVDHWEPQQGAEYSPVLWDLDDWTKLPQEIRGMFSETDPEYLKEVFDGVKQKTAGNQNGPADQTDDLGRFIESGVPTGKKVDGAGFHNTLHEYLGSREGKAATGAEMNKLMNARYNDYFWSLHLWIDGQYGRLLRNIKHPFKVTALSPAEARMTGQRKHGMKGAKPAVPKRAAGGMAKRAS